VRKPGFPSKRAPSGLADKPAIFQATLPPLTCPRHVDTVGIPRRIGLYAIDRPRGENQTAASTVVQMELPGANAPPARTDTLLLRTVAFFRNEASLRRRLPSLQSVFRFLEAAIRHRQWTTQTGPSCHHQIKGRYRSEAVGERADARYSLIGTARLNGLDPEPALKMLLQTLIQSQRKTRQE